MVSYVIVAIVVGDFVIYIYIYIMIMNGTFSLNITRNS